MAEYTIDKIEYGDNVYKLQDNVSGYVSGGNVIPYLTCGTAAGTTAKTTTLVTGTLPTTLTTGTRVAVRFTNSNTASNPTITIGSYGAIAIKRYGTTAPSTSAATSWNAGNVITLVYDGTYWLMADWTSPNTTYSEISETNITSGSGTSTGLVSGRRAKAAVLAFQTDEKLKLEGVSASETTSYFPILSALSESDAAIRQRDTSGFEYSVFTGTTSSQGGAGIRLGNSTATGTAGNKKGFITIYGTGSNSSTLYGPSGGTGSYNVWLPNNGGTLALTTDIPDVSGKIDTAGTGLSKSGTTLNHSNSVTAQTTQAVYPIKIDAQGHISAYGSAVTIPTVPSNIVNTITTTAGTHTAITSQKGNVSFNVPTKTSHLTNDSGFITSAGVTSITTTAGAHTAITNATGAVSFKVPTKTSHLTNDSGFITSYVDEKIKLTSQSTSGTYPLIFGPTSITSNSTYQGYYNTGITVNPNTKTVTATTFVGALTGTASGNLTSSSTLDATKLSGTIPSSCYTNTTYGISGSLSNHAFTSTLTAGGSGTTSILTLAAGTGITLTDDTTNKKITIACSVTNTDTKVSTAAVTSGTTYYPTLGSDTTSAATKFYDKTGFSYIGTTGSGSTSGTATLALGNNVAGSSGKCGYLDIYGIGQYKATLRLGSALTANRLINLPNKDGTIALTSDVVPKPPDDGNFGWVLKCSTNSASFWDPPSGFRFFIKEDSENPGTYSFDGNLPENIQEAWTNGTSLVLELDLLNASYTYDTYTLTDYYTQEVPTNDGCYYVLWFTDIFRIVGGSQKKITVGIYLDDAEVEHEFGEIVVDVREIGERYTINGGDTGYTTNISTSADQFKQLAVLNLSAGSWIITARARFAPTSSSNHYSAINIGTTTAGSGSTTTGNAIRDRRYGEGTYFNQHALTRIISLSTDAPVYLNGSGSVAGTWNRTTDAFQFDAIRIS